MSSLSQVSEDGVSLYSQQLHSNEDSDDWKSDDGCVEQAFRVERARAYAISDPQQKDHALLEMTKKFTGSSVNLDEVEKLADGMSNFSLACQAFLVTSVERGKMHERENAVTVDMGNGITRTTFT